MSKTEQVIRTDSTATKKERKQRESRIQYSTTDGNLNTKNFLQLCKSDMQKIYDRMLQLCNGKKIKGKKGEPGYQEFPFELPSEARIQHLEDRIAKMNASTFEQLRAGVKMIVEDDEMPD